MQNSNRYKVFSELNGLKFVSANFGEQIFEKHFHEEYVMGINLAGAHDFYFNKENHTAGQYEVTIIPPGELHTGMPHKGGQWQYMAIYPSMDFVKELCGNEQIIRKKDRLPSISDKTSYTLFSKAMSQLVQNDAIGAEDYLIQFLQRIQYDYFTDHSKIKKLVIPNSILRIKEFLRDQPHLAITLNMLAAEFSIDKYHLVRQFKRYLGVSPIQYHRHIRVSKSIDQLIVNRNIIDTALKFSFYDQSHYTNTLKNTYGFTPKQLLEHN